MMHKRQPAQTPMQRQRPSDYETMRKFETGATRDTDQGKLDYEGFLSPLALERYAEYMNENRIQADGKLRDSDNWQKGIPLTAYIKSLWRHFFDVWKEHRGISTDSGLERALCGIIFNAMGYLHEVLKAKQKTMVDPDLEKRAHAVEVKAGIRDDKQEKSCKNCVFSLFDGAPDLNDVICQGCHRLSNWS